MQELKQLGLLIDLRIEVVRLELNCRTSRCIPTSRASLRASQFHSLRFCEVIVTIFAAIYCGVDKGEKELKNKNILQEVFTGRGFEIVSTSI